MSWINFFNLSLDRRGTDDLISAEKLRDVVASHDGGEAYHSAFDMLEAELKCEEDTGKTDAKGKKIYRYHAQTPETLKRFPRTVSNYAGPARPALGYVWFDFDSKDGGETALIHARECLAWLNTPVVLSFYSGSKGFHLAIPFALFGLPESPVLGKTLNLIAASLKKSKWASLDTTVFNPQRKFRALGSKHPKTGLFKIHCDLSQSLAEIKECAKVRGSLNIPQAPECLEHSELKAAGVSYSAASQDAITLDEWRKYRQPDGKRAFEECGFLKHCESSPNKIDEPTWYAAASVIGRFKDGRAKFHAISRGHIGYSSTETDEKLEQALQASGPRTCKAINELWKGCSGCKHFEKIKSPVVILDKEVIPTEATGFYFLDISLNGTPKRIPDYQGLCDAYSRDNKFFRDSKADRTYIWNGTHYEVATQIDILAWCEEMMHPPPNQKVRNEFRAKIEANGVKPQNEIDSFFFVTTQGKLNLQNGVLDINTGSLYPHDERNGFRYTLPYNYDASADCPNFRKFLADITLGREDLQRTLLEFMGYCLWPTYDDHCFLWLAGGGRNGKSTFMDLVKHLVGEENTSAVLLDFFSKSNYVEMMAHKLLNISEESDARKIPSETIGMLKALSSGASVQVDQKYELPYMMKPTAKLIFASNTPPVMSAEDALKSRMIVVPFELRLEEHSSDATNSVIDWRLGEKLRAELPGILNLVLKHLRDFAVRSPRKIHRSVTSQTAMNEIMRDSDHIERWVQDRVTFLDSPSGGQGYATTELYEDFKKYLGSETEWVPEFNPFARRLAARVGSRCTVERKQIDGKRSQTYYGLSIDFRREF